MDYIYLSIRVKTFSDDIITTGISLSAEEPCSERKNQRLIFQISSFKSKKIKKFKAMKQ